MPATSPSWRIGRPAMTSSTAIVKQITRHGPEIGLGGDQQHRRAADGDHGSDDRPDVAGDLRPLGDHRRHVQDQRQLHDLARLELQRAEPEPAASRR